MSENGKISVIIPNYNKEKFIRKCIDSVLEQSYTDVEIVIVDDCSSDSSPEIIKEYQNKFPQVTAVLLEKNGGVSHARNTGIEVAVGDYITMLDSDDFYYNPKKLENEMEMLKRHNGKGIAYSYRQVVDEEGRLLTLAKDYGERYISGFIFYQLMTDKDAFAFVQRDYVLPKEYIIKVGGYRENEFYYEDFDLLLRLAAEYPMYYTGENGTAYRLVNSGLSAEQKKKDAKQFRTPQKIRRRYFAKLDKKLKIRAYIVWLCENFRLEIRIIGRKIKRGLGR